MYQLALFILLIYLTGCGQSGPLYLPYDGQPQASMNQSQQS